ncbi:MAG: hypothetical protein QXR19_15810 [Candidatus Jordarchaeaceae archaeon]
MNYTVAFARLVVGRMVEVPCMDNLIERLVGGMAKGFDNRWMLWSAGGWRTC